jgi:hypothetical protein
MAPSIRRFFTARSPIDTACITQKHSAGSSRRSFLVHHQCPFGSDAEMAALSALSRLDFDERASNRDETIFRWK